MEAHIMKEFKQHTLVPPSLRAVSIQGLGSRRHSLPNSNPTASQTETIEHTVLSTQPLSRPYTHRLSKEQATPIKGFHNPTTLCILFAAPRNIKNTIPNTKRSRLSLDQNGLKHSHLTDLEIIPNREQASQ